MGIFDDAIAEDYRAFADGDYFADVESITYTKVSDSSTSTFKVAVERGVPVTDEGGTIVPALDMWVPKSSTATIGMTAVETGDTITVAEKRGGTARAHTIREIVEQDAGGWLVRCY